MSWCAKIRGSGATSSSTSIPAGETPVLVDSTAGIMLIGSQPIVEYFEETVDKMPMIHGNAVARAEIRRLTIWFDEKLFREVVEPLMNERMRKRLVSRESPDTRVLREAMRIANGHLDYVDYLLDHRRWLAGAGPKPRRLHRRGAFERDRLSRRARLARAQADQGLVRRHEVAPCFRPLLGERMEVIVPPAHYDKVDF